MKRIYIGGEPVWFTHKGWLGPCPIYISNIDSDCPMVHPRHWVFIPLAWATEMFYLGYFETRRLINWDYEPRWKITVTGRI